jgi:hypothetical protein
VGRTNGVLIEELLEAGKGLAGFIWLTQIGNRISYRIVVLKRLLMMTLACVARSSRICDSIIELGLWAVFPSRPDVFRRPLFSSRLPS